MDSSDKENSSQEVNNRKIRRIASNRPIVSSDSDSNFQPVKERKPFEIEPPFNNESDFDDSQPIRTTARSRRGKVLSESSEDIEAEIAKKDNLPSDENSGSESSENPQDSDNDDDNDDENSLILDTDKSNNEQIIVNRKIAKHLKPHQIDGIRFMYNSCYTDLNAKRVSRKKDHGCILAHCMGLGKTLSLISLVHTLINYPKLKTARVLVLCPKSTILNWKTEIENWLQPIKTGRKLQVFTFPDASTIEKKIELLGEWFNLDPELGDAGCLLVGYEAFRAIVLYDQNKKANRLPSDIDFIMEKATEYLLKPGADLVVLDEGHKIKNLKSATSRAVNKISTKRRIILTGTPMQNNLNEYFSMVDFIKPGFLGNKADFSEYYANSIRKGQHRDSSDLEVQIMKEKSYILHKKLSKFIQVIIEHGYEWNRRDVAVLKEFLPEKFEYDIFIPMTDIQHELYDYYLTNNPLKDGKNLLPDYQVMRKIWTHPKVLETSFEAAWATYRRKNQVQIENVKKRRASSEANSGEEDSSDYELGKNGMICGENGSILKIRMFSPLHDWWKSYVTQEQRDTVLSSNKLEILFAILKLCERQNEKCLIFSEYTKVLDVVEFVMKQITEQIESGNMFDSLEKYVCGGKVWKHASDYYRMDGSTSKSDRQTMIQRFNDRNEKRLRVFLISSRAGGQGINLTGANRVVLLDTSWNPSNDQQSIFRVYRMGQKKKCFIYRLLAMGTMEEKVYSRSVTKQATSCRVIDKQQVERHYDMAELIELYTLTKPNLAERPQPNWPDDHLLKFLLHNFPEKVYKYHEHDSLLEREDDLTEEQKDALWKRYELEAMHQGTSTLDSQNQNDENDSFWDVNILNAVTEFPQNVMTPVNSAIVHTPSDSSKQGTLSISSVNPQAESNPSEIPQSLSSAMDKNIDSIDMNTFAQRCKSNEQGVSDMSSPAQPPKRSKLSLSSSKAANRWLFQ